MPSEDSQISHKSSSSIHQFQLNYNGLHDRLVLKLITQDQSEYRFWLTRRLVQVLWGVLVQVLDQHEYLQSTAYADKQKVEDQFNKELKMSQEGFVKQANKYALNLKKMPLGEEPILVSKIQMSAGPNGVPLLGLFPEEGSGIQIPLSGGILHAILKLIQEGSAKGGWGLNLVYNVASQEELDDE